jgi:hypothetical protein
MHWSTARAYANIVGMPKTTQRRVRKASRKTAKKTIRLQGERVPQFAEDFVIIRTDRFGRIVGQAKSMRGEALLKKGNKALVQSGIQERTVFRDAKTGVFAYSVDPQNPRKIVRQSADGKKTVGRFSHGRFRAG